MEYSILYILLFLSIQGALLYFLFSYKNRLKLAQEDNKQILEALNKQSKKAHVGDMVNNIIHQWKQPLSTIMTVSSSLKIKKEIDDLDDKSFFYALDTIKKTVNHMTYTADCFRDFIKGEEKQEKFLLNDIIDRVLEIEASNIKRYNIKVQKIQNNNIFLQSSSQALIHALINIIVNASDELVKIKKNRLISLQTSCTDEKVYISVIDNAGGIPPENINKIFKKHFTTKQTISGTGIGLHIAKELIEKQLGGSIFVENNSFEYNSKEYTGAKFTISIPLR